MGIERKDLVGATAQQRFFSFFWPKFETDAKIETYLKSARLIVFCLAGWSLIVGAAAIALGWLPSGLSIVGIAGTGVLLAGIGHLLYRRHSRVMAALLMVAAIGQIAAGGGKGGTAIVMLLLVFGINSLRATIVWHKLHPTAIRWRNVAIAAVGTTAIVLVTAVAAAVALFLLAYDQNFIDSASGTFGILMGIAAATLLTRKFPTTAAATSA